MENQKGFTFIDLFSGIGGFNMALTNNGGECIGFSEINNDAINTYCENLDETWLNNLGDIKNIKSLPEHDILTAGVPCQSWSIAGRNLGFDDDRGQLWNDTIYLLQQAQPKAFIFENVKGLVDPRNKKALSYILERIQQAGYYCSFHIINSFDYGVPQNRVRVYIIGFKEKQFFDRFSLPKPLNKKTKLADIIGVNVNSHLHYQNTPKDLFGNVQVKRSMSLSTKNGVNDYFLFNDLRNGDTTIHSWDIIDTTKRQKEICYLLLKNRRKSTYGILDGNPLSIAHFKSLDSTISENELNGLLDLEILKKVEYAYEIIKPSDSQLSDEEIKVLNLSSNDELIIDHLKVNRNLKLEKISISKTLDALKHKNIITCKEFRYDFKNTKISTGLFGVNRIFLPSSDIFPTLVASDTNDYITTKEIPPLDKNSHKDYFLNEIYLKKNFRKITKNEACLIQGFPEDYKLPESRPRWMKLIGNSVSVPVIETLCKSIIQTGVFANEEIKENYTKKEHLV